jgi:DNA polymerase elongation subunit (family B)
VQKRQAKRVGCIDIETAPIVAHRWQLFDPSPVGLNQIVKDWAILSFCLIDAKGKVEYMDTSSKDDPYDDRDICERLWYILHEYDVLVAQNGVAFDMKKIRARLLHYDMPPPSPCLCVDTLQMAKRVAKFTSNKLAWLSQWLSTIQKLEHSKFPGHALWVECLRGTPKAWAEMRKYNIVDVKSTWEVYLRLLPWQSQTGQLKVVRDLTCPTCGSLDIMESGVHYSTVREYTRYQCRKCLTWARGST